MAKPCKSSALFASSKSRVSDLEIQTAECFLPLLEPARYKGAKGGRGSGKSHNFAEMLVERCLMYPGTRWACIREVQKSLNQSVKLLIEDKIKKLGVGHLFDVQESKVITPGDGILIFQGMQNHTADSIKSLEGFDGAWVEEAHSLSQRSLDLLRPTIRKPGSELWFSWNPQSNEDPVDVLLCGENPPPNSVVVTANYWDNPWFPDVLRDEMEYDKRSNPEKYRHVWEGEYQNMSEARVFHNWRVEEFEVPKDATIRQGADWGYAVDPTTLIQCYIEGRTLYIPYEAYRVGCEIVDIPNLFLSVPDSHKWPIIADSSRPETISHLQKNGFPKVYGAIKGARSIEEGVEFLRSYEIVVHPRCVHTIDELKHYSFKVDDLTGKVLPVLQDKNNHIIDALRYANEGARRATAVKRKPAVSQEFYGVGTWMG